MTEHNNNMDQLLQKLENLIQKQEVFTREISVLKQEIYKLKSEVKDNHIEVKTIDPSKDISIEAKKELAQSMFTQHVDHTSHDRIAQQATTSRPNSRPLFNIEKFVGENLINKIGIAITVIGVAIGAQYSIEHELISPLTRILLGYAMGIGLLGFGIKLKTKYEHYSAVLVSGAIAIMYFITYFAYDVYELIPQLVAFGLMLSLTGFTVLTALHYNKQVIAHIGLVGAYAVPFLLSQGSGNIHILFSYIALINIGILLISVKKYWKSVYYTAFVLTWLIYSLWFVNDYNGEQHATVSSVFLLIFFGIFYVIFLAYKVIQKEIFAIPDVVLLLANSFVFYGLGYAILMQHTSGEQWLGLFTLCNGLVHFTIAYYLYKKELADRNLFYLVAGLVLVFITMAIPVQLDGHWVTMLWSGEAALLYWIGKNKGVRTYELLSYPLMALAFFSIIHDWQTVYNTYRPEDISSKIMPLWNINFLTSVLVVSCFGFITYIHATKTKTEEVRDFAQQYVQSFIAVVIPAVFLFLLYTAFRIEITTYWDQRYTDSYISIKKSAEAYHQEYWNYDLSHFKIVWIINYSLLFFSILSLVNSYKLKHLRLGIVNLAFNTLTVAVFLVQGLYYLSELRDSYINQNLSEYYSIGYFNIGIRYISYAFVALIIGTSYRYIQQRFLQPLLVDLKLGYDIIFYLSILWIASSELITWMYIMKSTQSYKLGLSILWGIYALVLIGIGIWKNKKHVRIGAIGLFAVTLLKLFFYDIVHLNTISKTIVLVSLGILMLIVSFLYNKYKHLISEDHED